MGRQAWSLGPPTPLPPPPQGPPPSDKAQGTSSPVWQAAWPSPFSKEAHFLPPWPGWMSQELPTAAGPSPAPDCCRPHEPSTPFLIIPQPATLCQALCPVPTSDQLGRHLRRLEQGQRCSGCLLPLGPRVNPRRPPSLPAALPLDTG